MNVPHLTISGLTVTGDGARTLLTVDALAIAPGSRVGIRGPSGAGKSTLLHALAGLVRANTGDVRWGEANLAAMSHSECARFRRENVGLIFQDFLLFEELSAAGNAALAASFNNALRRSTIREGARTMLAHLGLADHANRSVSSFSGGERQRVAVSRALASDPAIILADEPTASLDRHAADRLIDDLATLAATRGKTLIAVSHDAALHARMDRVLDVVDGRLVGEA